MEKNARLADIYIKIYNKRPLFMEDLAFLAKYDAECFEKTCHNLIYNIPEAKQLLEPLEEDAPQERQPALKASLPENRNEEEVSPIDVLLDNLKKMEWQEMPVPALKADKVKHLLGSLYMEQLFPHNDRYRYFDLGPDTQKSIFNRKV